MYNLDFDGVVILLQAAKGMPMTQQGREELVEIITDMELFFENHSNNEI